MKKIIFAVPKGRILDELVPIMNGAGIKPEKEFFATKSRKLMFETNLKNFIIIRVRAFDVATFVAFGAAHMGVVGDDVLNEFNYQEIINILDLKIGKCRLSIANKSDETLDNEKKSQSHVLVATKYKNTVTKYFAEKGIRAECIKLNGAIELAPKLGICSTIVDLVSTGKTLRENNLKECEVIYDITSKLVINKIAYKLMNKSISEVVNKFSEVVNG